MATFPPNTHTITTGTPISFPSTNATSGNPIQLRHPPTWFAQPADGATWFCDLLIVGGSTAAYAAALAALGAGQRVCLVQPHSLLGGYYGPQAIASWHHGHLLRQAQGDLTSLAGEAFAMSRLQQTLRATYRTLEGQASENEALLNQNLTVKAAAITATIRQLLMPYLTQGQCQIIGQAVPTLTLYATRKYQPYRITQICFKSLHRRCLFRIHPKAVIDATESAGGLLGLAPDLSHDQAALEPRQTLTPFDFLPSAFLDQRARGSCFADTVGIAEVGLWQTTHPLGTPPESRLEVPLQRRLSQALAQSAKGLLPGPFKPLQDWFVSVSSQLQTHLQALQSSQPDTLRGLPITLPLGAFLPRNIEGLVWAGHHIGLSENLKSLGQFFPVAWATGEASAHIALTALKQPHPALNPLQTLATQSTHIQALQKQLLTHGIPLVWLDDIATDDPDFKEIQWLTLQNIIWFQNHRNLHFDPERIVSDDLLALCLKTTPGELAMPNLGRSSLTQTLELEAIHPSHRGSRVFHSSSSRNSRSNSAPLTHRGLARQVQPSFTCYEDAQCLFPSLA
jgi:FAD dependent oxidoreductase